MKLLVKYKNGLVDLVDISNISHVTKNPCVKCRKDGGCFDHGCFLPEDWGDFIVSTTSNKTIRVQDIQELHIKEI